MLSVSLDLPGENGLGNHGARPPSATETGTSAGWLDQSYIVWAFTFGAEDGEQIADASW